MAESSQQLPLHFARVRQDENVDSVLLSGTPALNSSKPTHGKFVIESIGQTGVNIPKYFGLDVTSLTTMFSFKVSRSENVLSRVILPSSLRMVVCASWMTAKIGFSTP
jgi:hypothetical protein